MDSVDSRHFLLDVINSAEDISLFLENYNACLADDVLRGNVTFDKRPLVIIGSEKRHAMCRKKLPQKYKELKMEYDPSIVAFILQSDLKDFVQSALGKIRSGESLEPEVLAIEHVPEVLEVLDDSAYLDPESTEKLEQVEEESGREVSATTGEEHEVQTKQYAVSTKCNYGVPKFNVEYIVPNVMGLQESLFVNVDEEDLAKFFDTIKGRVLNSIGKDN